MEKHKESAPYNTPVEVIETTPVEYNMKIILNKLILPVSNDKGEIKKILHQNKGMFLFS